MRAIQSTNMLVPLHGTNLTQRQKRLAHRRKQKNILNNLTQTDQIYINNEL